jgi:chromosome segregation ATPase
MLPEDERTLEYLEGRLMRLESEQKALRRIHGQLSTEIERLNQQVQQLRAENDRGIDPWHETTDVRNQRRAELDSLRARARNADQAEMDLILQKARFTKQLVLLVPTFSALLVTLIELIRSLVHH